MRDAVGNWTIRDVAPGEATSDLANGEGDGWIAASEHDTYRALIAAGRLADPYVGRHEHEAAWVRTREWWWHAPIDLAAAAPGERVELVFEGLDTFADVFLDGALLGRADNMFRTWRFDLAGVAAGRHDLAVRFHPTAAMTGDAPLPVWTSFTDRVSRSRRTLIRKAQFGWGWDWGPDLPTVGVWRPARIERWQGAAVRSVGFTTLALADDRAAVRIDVDLTERAAVTVELHDPDGAVVATGSRDGTGPIDLAVPDPRPWWTADLGAQPLYTLVARTDAHERRERVGLRTIAIDESPDPDEPGASFFRFVLNGVPIFAKGACWVPADSAVGAVAGATYRDLLARAVDANMNMIRVWGGGIYEPDLFYDECDRRGLLVWQDFMFACAPYPDDDGFLANVHDEVREQVARLRHHACLALWCGNNENQAIQWFDDLATGATTPLGGLAIYDELIPAVLAELDPATPYRASSPLGGPTPNSMRAGDVHNWTVWHGIPLVPDADPVGGFDSSPEGVAFTRYAEDHARFVSEFGIQAAPGIATLRRWMAPDDLHLGSAGFLDRIKDVADKASAMMLPVTGAPATLKEYVAFTQLTQAEGLAFGIEHYRRRKPHCSGTLIWQHNDCWPCVSWSLVDYDGVAKPSWYAVARAFAPVMASFRRDGDRAEFWIVNDTLAPVRAGAVVALARFDGVEAWSEAVPVEVAANAAARVWTGVAPSIADGVLTVRANDGAFPANRLLPAAVKHLPLVADPGLSAAYDRTDAALRVTVRARAYALAVRLRSDDPSLRFDTNYVDLAGGEEVVVTVTSTDGGPVDRDAVEIACWNGTAQ